MDKKVIEKLLSNKIYEKLEGEEQLKREDYEDLEYITNYTTILVASYLDHNIKEIILEFFKQMENSERMTSYIRKTLDKKNNFRMSKIIKLLKSFDEQWSEEIKKKRNYTNYRLTLEALMDTRNNIAHSTPTPVSSETLHLYYNTVNQIIAELKEIIFKNKIP